MIRELIEYCKIQAMLSILSPSEETVWRAITRRYSKTFNTPLSEVRNMDPEKVILEVFEDQLDGADPIEHVEDFLEQIYTIEDPNYVIRKEEDLEAFIKGAEKREEKRIKKEKMEQEEIKKALRGGKVDFSGLNEENER